MNLQLRLEKGLYDPGSIEKKPLCYADKNSKIVKSNVCLSVCFF